MYIELDHDLVPGKISGINTNQNLPTGKEPQHPEFGSTTTMNEKRYQIHHGDIVQAIRSHNSQRNTPEENQKYQEQIREDQSLFSNINNFGQLYIKPRPFVFLL